MATKVTRLRPEVVAFLGAKAISDVGYALDFVCLSVFVWERTRSALATGLVSVALYGGAIVGGQGGRRYGRSWNRRGVMIGADVARMAALVLLTALPDRAQTWWLYPAVVLVGVGRSVFEATLSAATPVLAADRAQTMNSVLAGLRGIAFVIGMGGATVVVPVLGYRGVFGLDAASYALSALVLTMLRLPMRVADLDTDVGRVADRTDESAEEQGAVTTGNGVTGNSDRRSAAAKRAASWPVLVAAGIAPLIVLRGFDAFGSASQQVGLPILGTLLRPGAPTRFAGSVWSAWAAGLFVAGFVLRPLASRLVARAPSTVFCLATIVMSAGFIGVFWLPGWWPRLTAASVAGLGDAFSEITFKQAIQSLPDRERDPAFGLSQVVVNAGFMAGLTATSLVLSPGLVSRWVLLLHGAPVLLAAWLAATLGRQPRAPRRARSHAQEIAVHEIAVHEDAVREVAVHEAAVREVAAYEVAAHEAPERAT